MHILPTVPRPESRSVTTTNAIISDMSPAIRRAHAVIATELPDETRAVVLELARRTRDVRHLDYGVRYAAIAERTVREECAHVLVHKPALDLADQLAAIERVVDAWKELAR
jgi:hypothetical protein